MAVSASSPPRGQGAVNQIEDVAGDRGAGTDLGGGVLQQAAQGAHRRVRAGQVSCRGGRQALVVWVGVVGELRGVRAGAGRGWWDGGGGQRGGE
ncbi:hypothetical protein BEH93_27560 [Streptomyces sp. 2R]|nr:hypothetical protein BEH93_27560 [Streptomyces sp. 2R]